MTAHPLWQKFQKQIWNILLVIYICYIFVSVWIFIMSQSLGNFVPPALDAIKALMVVVAVFMFFIGIVAAVGVYSELYVEDVDGGSQACGSFPVWTLMATVTGLSSFLVVLLMGCAVTTLLMAMNEEDPAASALEHAYGEPELRTEFWETAYCVTNDDVYNKRAKRMKEACEAWSGGANRMYEERHPPPNCTDPTGWECEWELLPSEVLRAHSEVASNCSRAAEYAAAQNRTLEGEQCLRCWDVCMANLAEHMRESMFWSKWLSWLLVLQVCVIIVWDDFILQDPAGEDTYTKETLVERAQHAVDVCAAEYEEVEATLAILRARFEEDFETAIKMLGSMFTPDMREGLRTKPAPYLDHASPLINDCAQNRVHVHTGQRELKKKKEELQVHEQELVASLQRLDTHAEWQVSYKNKAVTIVLNGVVCFMAGLLLWASVYALYEVREECPAGEACAYQAAVFSLVLSIALLSVSAAQTVGAAAPHCILDLPAGRMVIRNLIRVSVVLYIGFLFMLSAVAIGLTIASAGSLVGMFEHYDDPEEIKVRLGSMFCTETAGGTRHGSKINRLDDEACVASAKEQIQVMMVVTSVILFVAAAFVTMVVYFTYVATKLSKAREDFDKREFKENLLGGGGAGMGSLVGELTLEEDRQIDGQAAAKSVGARWAAKARAKREQLGESSFGSSLSAKKDLIKERTAKLRGGADASQGNEMGMSVDRDMETFDTEGDGGDGMSATQKAAEAAAAKKWEKHKAAAKKREDKQRKKAEKVAEKLGASGRDMDIFDTEDGGDTGTVLETGGQDSRIRTYTHQERAAIMEALAAPPDSRTEPSFEDGLASGDVPEGQDPRIRTRSHDQRAAHLGRDIGPSRTSEDDFENPLSDSSDDEQGRRPAVRSEGASVPVQDPRIKTMSHDQRQEMAKQFQLPTFDVEETHNPLGSDSDEAFEPEPEPTKLTRTRQSEDTINAAAAEVAASKAFMKDRQISKDMKEEKVKADGGGRPKLMEAEGVGSATPRTAAQEAANRAKQGPSDTDLTKMEQMVAALAASPEKAAAAEVATPVRTIKRLNAQSNWGTLRAAVRSSETPTKAKKERSLLLELKEEITRARLLESDRDELGNRVPPRREEALAVYQSATRTALAHLKANPADKEKLKPILSTMMQRAKALQAQVASPSPVAKDAAFEVEPPAKSKAASGDAKKWEKRKAAAKKQEDKQRKQAAKERE